MFYLICCALWFARFLIFKWFCNLAGGTFALYSLICRHANVSLLPNRQIADEELSTYKLECPPDITHKSRIKVWLEKHRKLRIALLIMVMIGTCMVIGDGVLTPAISGTSAQPSFLSSIGVFLQLEILITGFLLCFFFLTNVLQCSQQFQVLSSRCPRITVNVSFPRKSYWVHFFIAMFARDFHGVELSSWILAKGHLSKLQHMSHLPSVLLPHISREYFNLVSGLPLVIAY